MASSIVLNVANFSSTYTAPVSDMQAGQTLKYFVLDKAAPPPDGLTQAQTNQYYLDAARDEIVRYIKQEAYKNRRRELQAASTIDATAQADTSL